MNWRTGWLPSHTGGLDVGTSHYGVDDPKSHPQGPKARVRGRASSQLVCCRIVRKSLGVDPSPWGADRTRYRIAPGQTRPRESIIQSNRELAARGEHGLAWHLWICCRSIKVRSQVSLSDMDEVSLVDGIFEILHYYSTRQ